MESAGRDGAAVRLPPPLVYLFAVIAGGVLHELVLPWRIGLPLGVRLAAAAVLFLFGLGIGMSAFGLFRKTGQDPKPWVSTPEIISTGSFRVSRNPMYVGMAAFQASIGVAWGTVWILALVPVVLIIVYLTAVRHEEAYLEGKFGETYLAYKRTVRRWL